MSFERLEHRTIAGMLGVMDASFLIECRCYFADGTAIVLANGEYRLSRDLDFLCAETDGYRNLRDAVRQSGAAALFGPRVEALRDFRIDQYGIRSILAFAGEPVRFEIVREARISLEGSLDERFGVPVLCLEDQFAEKLLANADRYVDKAVACRDAVDLGYLLLQSGTIPRAAIEKATTAYGTDIPRALAGVLSLLSSAAQVRRVAEALAMAQTDVARAAGRLKAAALLAWPALEIAPRAD
ncbi:nucleotidyl transferase AbiEii/AbiGii toxin family protein [Aurantimonas sp. Leaf443]|uniref:nucleotidyl transferase AbiEii/AbiGii toxin family protein n=1 Tax=Aurantimonas sp. Leaf443 TaxID=1736378 RepID=UPI000700D0C3|nr:nucleotidyl transferase AbiEii/AbiGii toxin family protein [Aurantimonas sp. Leaf443]KQT85339.1 hypothetical protein ASG48_08815 [Aurantimonas sp. Leaf443]